MVFVEIEWLVLYYTWYLITIILYNRLSDWLEAITCQGNKTSFSHVIVTFLIIPHPSKDKGFLIPCIWKILRISIQCYQMMNFFKKIVLNPILSENYHKETGKHSIRYWFTKPSADIHCNIIILSKKNHIFLRG